MIKKTMTIFFVTLFICGTNVLLNAQADSKDYIMMESVLMTPDNSNLKVLGENMRKHNAKYHKDGPYKASVYTISTGPNTGKIVWMMGPLMYKHLDSRPEEGGHDEDWRDNVMPYIKKIHTAEYWRMDDKVSNMSMMDGDNSKYPIIYVRYGEIDEDHGYALDSFFEMVGKTVKAMDGENPWGLYYNEFRQGNLGRHLASVSFLKNWAELDDERVFKKTFEETIGKNKWQKFMDMSDGVFSNSWDEIWTYSAHMSGK
ncbi:hypothetical protein KFZ70_00665 [Tamlana fucoidanivorans]|uniref:Uncharacterized protein n=1 Tax=Allotamlana fucoidanivorans TaxID=2583814 RepID=A0A5C4SKL0_9FLAO|nr:hypothetical protein [Tamlana fucoidanivorans]TNJ44527.1 hypothetical protein FGF67_07730 [Tamlana fucoidanivorans]